MLSCENLSLQIKDRTLFRVGFTLFPGSITIVHGSNGSGKSSLLRIIAGIQRPTNGEVFFQGISTNLVQKPYANYIGHNIGIKEDLTVLENITIWSRLHESEAAMLGAIHYFGLMEILRDKVFTLSAGNRQKVALARLLACKASLWLLDEVEVHLDENNRILLNNLITTRANNGGIVIIVSHSGLKIKNAIELDMRDFRA